MTVYPRFRMMERKTRKVGRSVVNQLLFFVCFRLRADGAALYRAFLLREFSNENLEFWLAVEDYKNSKPQKMAAKAQQIYNDFVAVEASKEVCFQSVIDSFFFIDFDLISAGFLFFVTKLTPSISISCFLSFLANDENHSRPSLRFFLQN